MTVLSSLNNNVFFVALMFIVLGNTYTFSQDNTPVFKTEGLSKEVALGQYMSIIEDESNSLTFADILNNNHQLIWRKSDKDVPSFGYTTSTIWLKLTLEYGQDHANAPNNFLLELANPLIKVVEYYYPEDNGYQMRSYGTQHPFDHRENKYRNFVINLDAPTERATYYFKLQTIYELSVPLYLWPAKKFNESGATANMLFGMFVGILLIMLFYNLIMYFNIRDKAYLYYVLYVLGFLFFGLCKKGYAFQFLWPEGPIVFYTSLFFVKYTALMTIQFSRLFLKLGKKNPLADKIGVGLMVFLGVLILLGFLWPSQTINMISTIMVIVTVFFIYYIGIYGVIKKHDFAWYYIISWIIFASFAMLYAMVVIGILPTNNLTKNAVFLGSALEVSLMSFALSYRFRLLSEEKNRALSQLHKATTEFDRFVYSASHDLRGPTASILGLVNIARKEVQGGAALEIIDKIENSANRQDSIIRDMQNISKNLSQEVKKGPVDFEVLVNQILNNHNHTQVRDKFDIRMKFDQKAPFYSDSNRITIALSNLIANAIQYANGKEAPVIDIGVTTNNIEAKVIIKDNGVGIEKEHMGNIFNMFYRANENSPGFGIGLYMAKETIEKVGGKILIESEAGRGTDVTLNIPQLAAV